MKHLWRSPGLSISVVLLLGLGIGANTALFSVLQSILLRPIPGVERPADLVRISRSLNGQVQGNQSYPDYLDLRDQTTTLDGLAAERLVGLRMSGEPAQMVTGAIVTGNYFTVLGVKAAEGRLLTPDDNRVAGGHPVVVLSHRFWERQFAADPGAVGRTVVLNGYSFTIVGVAAAPFEGVAFGQSSAMWMPLTMVKQAMTRSQNFSFLTERRAGWLTYYGRLKPGVRPQSAEADLNTIARRLADMYPKTNAGRSMRVFPHADMPPDQRAGLRNLLAMLLVAVALVLAIACGNVATLLLARAAARSREIAIRLALGAGGRTIFTHMMGETLILGLAGGGLGLLLTPWIGRVLRTVWNPQESAREISGGIDLGLLAFTLGVSLLTVLFCGLAPAWMAYRTDPAAALRDATPRGSARNRLQRFWVVAQVSLSVALVAGGSLVLGSMKRIVAIDPGYRTDRIAMASMDLSVLGYGADRGMQRFADLLQRASSLPGVRSATLAKSSPAVDWSDHVTVRQLGVESARTETDRNTIAPGYFRTLEIALLAGRDFTMADRAGSTPVAIVSRTLAAALWPGQNPIGKQLVVPVEGLEALPPPLTVIGVAADSRYRTVLDAPPPLMYVPLFQNYDSISRLMVASDTPPEQMAGALLRALHEANPELPVRVSTMRDQVDISVWKQRAAATLLTFFGILALGLACAGIHGVVSYATAQRKREMAIRMAVGAERVDVVGQVVGSALRLTAIGIALGLPLAWWARPLLSAFLYQSSAVDPWAFLGVPLLFALIATAAAIRPAQRAAAIDPAMALRQE